MQSTAQIQGHPIHPMLIPYPFALLTGGTAFDIAARLAGRREWARTAGHLTTAGIATALAAAVPGAMDYVGSVPAGRARRTATLHAFCNLTAVACFALLASRRRDEPLTRGEMALSLAGTGLLSIGGLFGGELAYREHVGMIENGAPSAPEALPPPGWASARVAIVAAPGVL